MGTAAAHLNDDVRASVALGLVRRRAEEEVRALAARASQLTPSPLKVALCDTKELDASSMSCWHAPPGMASRQVSSQLRPVRPHTHRFWYLAPSDTQRNVLTTRPVSPSHETEPLPAKPGVQVGKHDVGARAR